MVARSPVHRPAPLFVRIARAAVVSLALALPSVAAAETRIAVVDVQHAVMQTEDGIRAQATLKKLFDRRQQELDAKQTELQRAREDIEKQSRVLSRESLQKRMEDWQRQMVELQTVFVDYNKELQKKQGELTGPILKKMMIIVARIAKKSGYEIIFDKQAAPYVRADLDLTEQVIQLYNTGGGEDDASGDKAEKKDDAK
ncbi:OmpH family outer membrane protein [Sorangium sp. So ce375]|uniref:OmpH family outer membrane protein n=1 Tax=Sorangium sp. So ce375 TaxID=3133306 RepID=UPI003F5AE2C0